MSRERPNPLLQSSALINEVYVRLIDWKAVRWHNRVHFFGVAAQMMRRILVDFARQRPRAGKDQEAVQMSLDEALTVATERDPDLLALDDVLKSLATIDERRVDSSSCGFFRGLSVKLYLGEVKTKRVREVFSSDENEIRSVDVSADGKMLYFLLYSSESDIWLLDLE